MIEYQQELSGEVLYRLEKQIGKNEPAERISSIFENLSFEQATNYLFNNNIKITPTIFHRLIRLIKKKDRFYLSDIFLNTQISTNFGEVIRNSHFYSSIISRGKKGPDFYSIAKKAFEEAKTRGKANVFVYSSFMDVANNNKKFEEAKKAFEEAEKVSEQVNSITYNIAIDTFLNMTFKDEDEKIRNQKEAKNIFNTKLLPSLQKKFPRLSENFQEYDFHGLSHGAAKCYIDYILEISKPNEEIRLITGRGLHNKFNESVMKGLCSKHLEDNFSKKCTITRKKIGSIELQIAKN